MKTISFSQDQTHTDSLHFSIIICSGCNVQYSHCSEPSPSLYHHTFAGNQIREVQGAATPPARAGAGVRGPGLPLGQGTCMLVGSLPPQRSGNSQLRQ